MNSRNELPSDGDLDPQLADLADDYLDGAMSETEELHFEERLKSDAAAREALVQALTLRSMLEMAFVEPQRKAACGSRCREVRLHMPAYRKGSLGPEQVAQLSRHLDDCGECARFYESLAEQRPAKVLGLRLILAAIVVGTGAVLVTPLAVNLLEPARGGSASQVIAPAETSDGVPGESTALTWQKLPLFAEDLAELAKFVTTHHPRSDEDPVEGALALVEGRSPGFLEDAAEAEPLRSVLDATGSRLSEESTTAKAALLLLMLHDDRLSPFHRAQTLHPLTTILPVWRDLYWSLATHTDCADIANECMTRLHQAGLSRVDASRVEAVFDHAIERRWPPCVQTALTALGYVAPTKALERGFALLRGTHGAFEGKPFPDPIDALLRAGQVLGPQDFAAELETISATSTIEVARAKSLVVLARRKLSADAEERLLGLIAAHDPRARLEVLLYFVGVIDRPYVDKTTLDRARRLVAASANEREPEVAQTAQLLAAQLSANPR